MTAFPSFNQVDTQSAWLTLRSVAGQIKSRATSLNTQAAAGPIGSTLILDFATFLADAKVALTAASAVPGIAAYAQGQINDNTFDIVASFNAMMAQVNNTTAWIIQNFPNSAGMLLARSFTVDNTGRTQDAVFTSAQTSGLRTILAALIATIN